MRTPSGVRYAAGPSPVNCVVRLHMDTPVLVAVIAAAAGLFASALTFLLTKSKERESDWRKVRIEQYKELISAMSEAVGPQPPDSARRRLALASNHVGLFASPEVL